MLKLVWVNGEQVDPRKPTLTVHDRGFLYGDGLFETIRVYNGQPLHWEEHLARLRAGCTILAINFSVGKVDRGIKETASLLEKGSLRLTVTRGISAGRGLLPVKKNTATAVITGFDGDPYPEHLYRQGFTSHLISFPRNHLSPLVKLKSTNSLELILGKMEAEAAGSNEGLFKNYREEITEGTTTNIFLVRRGRLLTPPVECGLLPGIMRARILLLAKKLGIETAEERIYEVDFNRADESFLTNSLLGIMPLVSFNEAPIGEGRPGRLTKTLLGELGRQ